MNFRSLHYFLTVAEEGNITRAARRLYITQQSLSGQILKLEEELGVTLFSRTPEFKLTYAGERLVLLGEQVCRLEQEIVQEADDISGNRRGKLRIGVSHTCGRAILPDILPEFRKTHPLVEIDLMEGNSSELERWIHQGEIDLMIGYNPVQAPGVETFELLKERLFLVCPKVISHQVLGMNYDEKKAEAYQNLNIHLFDDQPFILLKTGNRVRNLMDEYVLHQDFTPNIVLETENIETAFALSEEGMGLTVYPELFLNNLHRNRQDSELENLDIFPLPGPETVGTLVIAVMENSYHSKSELDFVALCEKKALPWRDRQDES